MKNIAIFASGSGTNAENIITYFSTKNSAKVTIVFSNRKDSFVLERARRLNVPSLFFERNEFYNTEFILNFLVSHKIDFIVLAGFLWLIPENILKVYKGRIVNIHPALLPRYGGKGMYGDHVHNTVIKNGEKESGITIHFVNESYDEGDIIFQARCKIDSSDTPDSLAQKIHLLEYQHYPKIIERLILKLENQ
jgi:phosphoribosylglycinamide formyltransferase-1